VQLPVAIQKFMNKLLSEVYGMIKKKTYQAKANQNTQYKKTKEIREKLVELKNNIMKNDSRAIQQYETLVKEYGINPEGYEFNTSAIDNIIKQVDEHRRIKSEAEAKAKAEEEAKAKAEEEAKAKQKANEEERERAEAKAKAAEDSKKANAAAIEKQITNTLKYIDMMNKQPMNKKTKGKLYNNRRKLTMINGKINGNIMSIIKKYTAIREQKMKRNEIMNEQDQHKRMTATQRRLRDRLAAPKKGGQRFRHTIKK
jgi:chemotaxis protein histidine kinase CheA